MKLKKGWRWVKCGEIIQDGDVIPGFPCDMKAGTSVGHECQLTRTFATQRKPVKARKAT